MLVHRFGILRKAIPMNVDVRKTNSLVLALCKLHNFCIDHSDRIIEQSYHKDATSIMRDGGLYCPRIDDDIDDQWEYDYEKDRVNGLLDGGHHFEDHSREDRRKYRNARNIPNDLVLRDVRALPNDIILNRVFEQSYKRPSRSRSRRNSI